MEKYNYDFIADQEPNGNSEWYPAKEVDEAKEQWRKEKEWLIQEVRYGSFQKSDEICERMYQELKEDG